LQKAFDNLASRTELEYLDESPEATEKKLLVQDCRRAADGHKVRRASRAE